MQLVHKSHRGIKQIWVKNSHFEKTCFFWEIDKFFSAFFSVWMCWCVNFLSLLPTLGKMRRKFCPFPKKSDFCSQNGIFFTQISILFHFEPFIEKMFLTHIIYFFFAISPCQNNPIKSPQPVSHKFITSEKNERFF